MTWSRVTAGKKADPHPRTSQPSPSQAEGPSPRLELGGVVRRAREAPGALTPRDVMVLQRTIGNRATCSAPAGRAAEARPPAPAPVAARLPDRLRAGVERLSGLPMGDVRVHYGSPEPAGVDAAAYARGGEHPPGARGGGAPAARGLARRAAEAGARAADARRSRARRSTTTRRWSARRTAMGRGGPARRRGGAGRHRRRLARAGPPGAVGRRGGAAGVQRGRAVG